MATTVAKLNIHLGANAGEVTTAFNSAGSTIQNFSNKVQSLAGTIRNLVAAYAGMQTVRSMVSITSDAEDAAVAFKVMLGSAESAKAMLEEIQAMSLVSPQTNVGLRSAAKYLLNLGIASGDIIPTLRMLTDVVGANEENMKLLSAAYAQVASAGKLRGQDLLQIVPHFNLLAAIMDKTGESSAELRKRMEDGLVPFSEVKAAFESATKAGGKYFGMTSEMSKTLAGRMATLKDSITLLAVSIGNALLPSMKSLVESGISSVGILNRVDIETVKGVIRIAAMVAAYAAFQRLIPMIVGGVRAIVEAYRAWATAQATLTALQGVKGIAMVAGGLAAATLAAVTINQQFDSMTAQMKASEAAMMQTKSATDEITASMDEMRASTAKAVQDLESGGGNMAASVADSAQSAAERIDEVKRKYREMEDALRGRGGIAAVERFSTEGFQAIFGAREDARVQDEIRKLREEEAKHVERLERASKEIANAVKRNQIVNNEVNV